LSDTNLPRRRQMVDEQLRARGIRDERVLAAMEQVPREAFVPPEHAAEAFSDRAVPLAFEQTVSQPYMVAAMTALLDLRPEHSVLEIGTGSGYQTAILARLARFVYTIERLAPLQAEARDRLESLGIHNVFYKVGDGSEGWPEESPFDRILVTAGAPHVPPALLEQLAEGGKLVIPVGGDADQTLTVIECIQGRFVETPGFPCRFVKLIGRQGWSDQPPPQEPP
jgi:protein-L-isoaspartate(D-aspartate) O-methyltransferase